MPAGDAPVLTETDFKTLYAQAAQLRSVGQDGAARELLLGLFDHGASAGGYGVVRLSFVLRDLKELANFTAETPTAEEKKARAALTERRDEREKAALKGKADFNTLQELVALSRTLGDAARSQTFYESLKEAAQNHPEIAAEIAEIRAMLSDLRREDSLPGDAEKIADQILFERLKRTLLELSRRVAEKIAGQPREKQIRASALEAKALIDRYRTAEEPPRHAEEKRRMVELSRETFDLLFKKHDLLGVRPQGEDDRTWLDNLTKDLKGLVKRYEINLYLLQDEQLRDGILELARKVASQVSEYRIEQDFGTAGGGRMDQYQKALDETLSNDGLLAYEVLLRINDDAVAEKLERWLLVVLRQDKEMYKHLADAAKKARKTGIERRLKDEGERSVST